MATLLEQLDAMLGLPANWDGYQADAPIPGVVALARDFVAYLASLERANGVRRNVRVHPTRVGGVQIEWEGARFERELELMPDGSLEFLDTAVCTSYTESVRFALPVPVC